MSRITLDGWALERDLLTDGQERVVHQNRFGSHHDSVEPGPEPVGFLPGFRSGDGVRLPGASAIRPSSVWANFKAT